MELFFVNPYPLVGVTIAILGLGITLYLLHLEAKSQATWLWLGFFSCFALAGMTVILANALWPWAEILVPLQDAFFVLGGVFLVLFAVHFPRRDEPFAAWAVLVAGVAIGLIVVGKCALTFYRFLAGLEVSIQPTGTSRWYYALGTLGALWVLLARAAHFALVDGAPAGGRLARLGYAVRCLVQPPNRDSLALRNFALVFCFGLVPGIIILLPLNAGWAYPAGLGALLTMAGMMLVYLNHIPRPTTFIVKLAGISLVTLLLLFDLFGMVSLAEARDQVRRHLEIETLWVLQAASAGEPIVTPSAIVSIVAWPQGAASLRDEDLLYLRGGQAPPDLVALAAETRHLAGQPVFVEPGVWLPGRWLGYDRFLLAGEGLEYIVDFHLREAVLPIHRRVMALIGQVLLGSLFIIAVFPLFFRYNLVRPLDRLLAGVKRANAGGWDVDVPVQFEDEIGFLTRSFNGMVRSLRQSDRRKDELNAALQRANAELERRVVERTADLAASEARYRELFETMTSGVAVYEAVDGGDDFVFRDFNRAAEGIEGMRREDVIGRRVTDIFPGVEAAGFLDLFRKVWQGRDVQYLPPTLYSNGRRSSWREGYVYQLPSGEIVAVYDDITEHRLAEEERRRLFTLSLDMLSVAGTDGFFKQLNPAWSRTLGWSDQELLSKPWLHFVHPDDREATAWVGDQLRAGEAVYDFQNRYRCRDGTYRWLSWNAVPLLEEEIFVAVARDITAQQRTQEALQESEERYRLISGNTGDVIWMLDLALGRFTYVSPSVERLRGYTSEEVMAQPLEASLTPASYQLISDDLPQRLAAFQAGDESMRVRTHRVDQPCKDGSIVPTEVVTTLITDSLGQVTKVLGVSRDITQRKQVEDALRQAKETADEARLAAEASSRAKSTFLANMSHELRTPLNAILGFSQLMAADANLTPDQQENLHLINRSGAHLLAIINDVLELSEAEAGHTELYLTDFDLHRMLQGLEDTFRLPAREKGLDLAFDRDPHVPRYVHADQNKLRQVLTNLLNNAVKYTEAGRIDVRLQARAPANTQAPDGLELHFEVEDSGVGMTPEVLDTLFVPFVQVGSRRQVREGVGLGVPLSHVFVRMMGGELTVRSQPGRGTLFRFHVIVEAVGGLDAQVARPDRGAAQPEGEVYRLLIAEDMEANRELLVVILEPLGLELRTAADGRQALDVWQAWRPHLILMDVRMPVLDGLEATRRIKATPQGQETVVVALTAHTTPRDRKALEEAGCDDFLPKPLRQEALSDALHRHLGLSLDPGASTEPGLEAQAKAPQQIALPLDFEGLPGSWQAKLRRAAVDADLDRLLYLIDQIQEIDASLAGTLRDWAHRFDYDTILAWLDRFQPAPGSDGERDVKVPE